MTARATDDAGSSRRPARDDAGTPAGCAEGSGLKQVSLARVREFGVVPKRDLGQNFLIDDNILGVILGLLEARQDDVILEVGAGLGVLTAALAGVGRRVHAFELDKSLGGPLDATLQGVDNVTLHFEDILRARLETLDPPPTLCASNLPYSAAGPFMAEALQRLPGIRRYCVMVQREVAERMTAGPGGKDYGTLSVWVGLYTDVVRVRPLARSIFFPQPRVDSSLVVLQRKTEEEQPQVAPERLRRVVQAAFCQRRKTLANSLSAGLGLARADALAAMTKIGLPEDVRAERLLPRQFVELAFLLV